MQILWYDDVESTMEVAHGLAQDGAEHGTTVVARHQWAGRGQRGRRWEAAEGGLWCSIVARPSGTPGLDVLAPRVGVAVALAIEQAVPAMGRLGLKWPNDIQCEGRKLGGVLCEARWSGIQCQWVVVGIGINVHNALPRELASTAIRLADIDSAVTVEVLVPVVAAAVAAVARNAGPLDTGELAAWAARDVLAGRRISSPMAGTGEGILPDGALLIRTPEGHLRAARFGVVSPTD